MEPFRIKQLYHVGKRLLTENEVIQQHSVEAAKWYLDNARRDVFFVLICPNCRTEVKKVRTLEPGESIVFPPAAIPECSCQQAKQEALEKRRRARSTESRQLEFDVKWK